MSKTRHFVLGFLWLSALLSTPLLAIESVVLLPGASNASTQAPVWFANPLQLKSTLSNVGSGAFKVVPTPDGQKTYVVAGDTNNPLMAYDQNFNNGRPIGGLSVTPTNAAISPDGKRLVVVGNAGVQIIDVPTDTILTATPLKPQGNSVDIAFSIDSTQVYILSNTSTNGFITPYNLLSFAAGTVYQLPNTGVSLTLAPNGYLYAPTLNRFFEINPRTMVLTPNGEYQLNASPTRPVFTSDGKYALVANKTPITGSVVILFNLGDHSTLTIPPTDTTLDRLVLLSNDKALGYSSQNNQLYDIPISNGLTVRKSSLQNVIPVTVNAFAVSNELPVKTLYAVATDTKTQLYKVDLASQTAIAQLDVPVTGGTVLSYVNPNPTSGGVKMLSFNSAQTIQPGAISLPLITRVLDSQGLPVFGARVDFTSPQTGISISPVTAFANSDGYAATYVTGPTNPGQYEIDAQSGGTTGAAFTVTIPGTPTGGGGSGNPASQAAITIVSGTGQVLPEFTAANTPLAVYVTDINGKPAVQTQVTFKITAGRGTISGGQSEVTVVTDANGNASVPFTASSVTTGLSFEPQVVTATTAVGSVTFYITTVLGLGNPPPVVALLTPDPDSTTFQRQLKGGAGTIIKGAIRIQIVAAAGVQAGQAIQNVALNVSPADAKTPGGTCYGSTPLTNEQGIATCDFQFNNVLGSGVLNVNVGGLVNTPTIVAIVTTGPPAGISKQGGDNQNGKPGDKMPTPLTVKVTDSTGAALPNIVLNWTVSKGGGTLSQVSTSTNSSGIGSAILTLGSNPGPVTVTVTAGTASNAPAATFSATVNVLVGSMVIVSGNNQTATTGQAFGQQLVVQVNDAAGAPVSGIGVSFAVASGSATLSSASGTTDATGRTFVNVTATQTPGTVLISATASGQSVTFSLNVQQAGPPVTSASFVNAASGTGGLTPCGIALAQGNAIVPALTSIVTTYSPVVGGALPTSFQGVDLSVNGVAAPLYYLGPNVIAFQTPCETAPGTATVVVRVNGGTTTVTGVPVAALQPGIFETTFTSTGSKKYAVLIRPDGSYVTPDNPARRGEQIKMFATGLGQLSTPTGTGKTGIGGQAVTANLLVGVNNGGVRLVSTEYLAGQVGVYVVTFEVPADTTPGTYQPLALVASGADGVAQYSNPSYFPIQ